MPPPRARARGGVALGVLGTLLLAFFVIVFMLGRHSHFTEVIENAIHDPRLGHHDEPVTRGAPGAPETGSSDNASAAAGSFGRRDIGLNDAAAEKAAADKAAADKAAAEKAAEENAVAEKAAAEKAAADKEAEKEDSPDDGGLSAIDLEYRPTKEMVQKIAQDGYLVVTWANWHYNDFVMTWVYHVKECGITGYIVGAMDDRLLKSLIKKDINTFSMKSGLTTGDFGWGSKTFAKMGREKIRLIALFLRLDVNVVIADVDVLWLKNPLPYFDRYPEADVLTSSDHLTNTHDGDALELWPQAASAANIGIMLFRGGSLDFVDEWVDVIEKDEDVWDQNAFNDLFRRGVKVLEGDPKHYFLAYNEKLKMGILPVALFCSGHTFFTQRMWKKLELEPYAVHATFQFSGTPGKKHRMRESMLFDDPPEYFDHPVGFVSFTMDGIERLLPNAGPRTGQMDLDNVRGHFDLVNHQLLRLRSALAVATVLGRALVVPELWCGLDRWWAPHAGTIPGSNFELPFQCPLDHVVDLEAWDRDVSIDAHGPKIEWRESSFFRNPRMPAHVNGSRVAVEVCEGGEPGCADGAAPAAPSSGKVRIQPNLDSEALKKALSGLQGTKVIDFETMDGAFGGFSRIADRERFYARLRTYTSIWCCIHAHPGHVHYDMLFDVPHVDKFGKSWNGTWELAPGP